MESHQVPPATATQHGHTEKRRESQKRKSEERRCRRGGRKVAIPCVVRMICGSGGSKSRLAKVAGAEPSGQMSDEKLHAVVVRAQFQVNKSDKN